MAIVNPSLLPGFDLNSTNSSAPSAGLQDNGYAFGDIPASSNHNYMFAQLYAYMNFLKDNGLSRWDAATTYKKQAMTVRNEIVFLSKSDGNISNDPLTTPAQWLSFPDWIYAPLKTTAITNAGSKSTLMVEPYFGTVASLKDSHTYYIRIETGTIDFPTNVEINISGLGAKPATIYLPTLNTQTGHVIAVQYIAQPGSERFAQAGKKTVGLDQVDNTSDLNKPVSTAVQTALNGKVTDGGKSLTTNGYIRLGAEYIDQWGSVFVDANSTAPITFPTSFTEVINAQATIGFSFSLSSETGCGIYDITTTGATISNNCLTGGTIYWRVLGRKV